MKANEMNLIERLQAPTPKFFRILRNIGLIIGAASAAILASPIALPVAVVTVAGYLVVASGVISAVIQTAVNENPETTSG